MYDLQPAPLNLRITTHIIHHTQVSTAHRSQGYDMGLVAILDKAETIKVYAEHPEHLK